MSSLYFRGKLAYARRFAAPPAGCPGALVITPGRGLLPPDRPVMLDELRAIARVRVDLRDRLYVHPFTRDLRQLARRLAAHDEVVLLGSLAGDKYLTPLRQTLGTHLRVPQRFIGLGDMSRGGLLLHCVRTGTPLRYVRPAAAPGPKNSRHAASSRTTR
jgi:hypothetical protein